MPLKIVVGDILMQSAEMIAIPALVHSCSGAGMTDISQRILEAANYPAMLEEYKPYSKLKAGEFFVTQSYRLKPRNKVKYVVHFFPCRLCDENYETSRRVYTNIINEAYRNGVRSIALMAYAEGYSADVILRQVRTDINWCLINKEDMEVTLVLPSELVSPMVLRWLDKAGVAYENETETQSVKDTRRNYSRSQFLEYLGQIQNPSRFAKSIDCSPSTITRIMNGDWKKSPQKVTVLLMAIGLNLSEEDRYAFINCAGHTYPFDERDFALERLIKSGHTNPRRISAELEEINPEWGLMNKSKGDIIPEEKNKTKKKQIE